MSELIQIERASGVTHLVFNRPDKKNSITLEMYEALIAGVDEAAADVQTRVLLISGAQGVFTAGNDLDDFIHHPPRDAGAPVFTLLRKLAMFEKPVVAGVEGLAIGLGTTVLLHCDLVYAAEDAKFALPFVNLGLVPEAASSLLLGHAAGHQRAAEKLLLGDPFPAREAVELGFVNRLLPKGEAVAFAMQQAQRLAALPSGSVMGTKRLMTAPGRQHEVLTRMATEIECFTARLSGPATQEAIAAFKEKRKPNFSGMV